MMEPLKPRAERMKLGKALRKRVTRESHAGPKDLGTRNAVAILAESDAIMVAAEAALSSCVEGHIIQAGNPTQTSGPLYRAWRNENNLWLVVPVTGDPDNPKRSPRISVEWARQQIAEYGIDNLWVRTNVFGEFPQTAFNSLIGADEVRAARPAPGPRGL